MKYEAHELKESLWLLRKRYLLIYYHQSNILPGEHYFYTEFLDRTKFVVSVRFLSLNRDSNRYSS